ncbi:MAG TPA: hypothetical protein VMD51_00770, partial [Mycobacterium sp.]|nr:hypothetical protein [Mycobacterium sp.]
MMLLFSSPRPAATPASAHAEVRPGPQRPGDQRQRGQPRELVRASGAVQRGRADEHRAGRDGGGGDDLRAAMAPELGGQHGGQQHAPDLGGDGHNPQRPQSARQRGSGGREQRGQGRLVDVSPRRVPAADDVVELVAVPAIAGGHRQMYHGRGEGDQADRALGQRHAWTVTRLDRGIL